MKLIGVLGGTFDPIHFGHLRMAQELADGLNLAEVRFIPAAHPPHRDQPQTSASHRTAMVSLAIADNPTFSLDERELTRSGPSYTIDTLQSLRYELGRDVAICLLLGSDAFVRLDTWHRWEEILNFCHIALVERPATKETLPQELQAVLHEHYTEDARDLASTSAGCITMQKITALDISATGIREILQRNRNPRYLMPDSVIEYIRAKRLYD